jgi:hypothetical protein
MRALLLMLLAGCSTTTVTAAAADPVHGGAPVVIELFTSQGCSSCPPADQLLANLAHAGQSNGRAIAPLAFHVDYWNDLGWTDPYSAAAWTERQQMYARALGDRVYTPELVVAGAAAMVGSQARKVAAAIDTAPLQLELAATAHWSPTSVTIDATAPAGADVWVAIWEDAPQTNVPSGENSGATLNADRVVRKLEHVAAAGQPGQVTVALGSGDWKPAGAVVFAQRTDRQIVGSRILVR